MKLIPEISKAIAPLTLAEQASTVSPTVTEWPETDLSLKQPFQQLTKITNTFHIIQIQQKKTKKNRKSTERTIEERKHEHCKVLEERELQLGVKDPAIQLRRYSWATQ